MLILLVGSSAYGAEEPASFLTVARKAEKAKDYRKAVYYLTGIAIGVADAQSNKLKKPAILDELKNVYVKAGQTKRAKLISSINEKNSLSFLKKEHINTNPIYSIAEYSDGTLAIYGRGEKTEEEKKLLNPKEYLEPPTDCFWALPTIVRPTDASYAETLKSYWWYHLPSKAELAKKQKFVPSEHVGPSPMGGLDFTKQK